MQTVNVDNVLRSIAGKIFMQADEEDIVAAFIAAATIKELDNRKRKEYVAAQAVRNYYFRT